MGEVGQHKGNNNHGGDVLHREESLLVVGEVGRDAVLQCLPDECFTGGVFRPQARLPLPQAPYHVIDHGPVEKVDVE